MRPYTFERTFNPDGTLTETLTFDGEQSPILQQVWDVYCDATHKMINSERNDDT